MAKKKPATMIPILDQFKVLLRALRKDLSRLGKNATEDLESYQTALHFAETHKIPGADGLLYSVLLYWQEREAEALVELEQVADSLPESLTGHRWNVQGVILYGLKRYDESIASHQKALDTPSYDTPGFAYNNMGLAYTRKKEYDRAIECYQKALDTPSFDTPGDAYHNMGVACSTKLEYNRAVEYYQKALYTPSYDTPHLTRVNLAIVYRKTGELAKAKEEIDRVLSEPDTENEHTRAKYVLGLIEEAMAGINPSPDEEALVSSSGRSNSDSPEERMRTKLRTSKTDQNDKYQDYLQRPTSERDNVFSCMRGWSSSVTLLEGSNDSHWRGGGYFLKWQGRGIVIDPGFDFIDNFHDADYTGKEISAVLISHNHSDHNYDLRSLDDLRYELHSRWKTLNPEGIDLKNYIVVIDEDTFKGFDPDKSPFRVLKTFDIKSSVRQKWLVRPEDIPMTVEHFPVEHGDDVSHAVGMRLLLHPDREGNDIVVGYTGDTEYFDVLSKHLQGCDVLIAHISMPDGEELGDDQKAADHFKKRHLGLNGTAKLIAETNPKLTLIGEFWAGRADIRIELIQALRKRTGRDSILPTGLGFHLSLPTLEVECTNCQKKVPHDQIKIAPAATPFGPLGYLCSNCLT